MIIDGANLGKKEVAFKPLTHYKWTNDEKIIRIIKLIEELYSNFYNTKTSVKHMECDNDGCVIIDKGIPNHRCSRNMESIREISKYGILASEWFGELESEREGCFCTFVSRMKGPNYLGGMGDLGEDDYSRLNTGQNIVLFFDHTNEIMKYLLHLDYFEYAHIKSQDPIKITEIYTLEEIEILNFIESLSPAGKNMRTPYDFKTNYWSAVPGGIPPFLINGICIKKNIYTDEELDEMNELFPNAIIFNNERKVVRKPLQIDENNEDKNYPKR